MFCFCSMFRCAFCRRDVDMVKEDTRACIGCCRAHKLLRDAGCKGYWEPRFIDGIVYE